MPVFKKIKGKLKRPLDKQLLDYGIHNELRRYIGKGKRVVPRFIPFINNNQLDITQSLKLQGIDPGDYSSAATQFDVPPGINIASEEVRKIPIKTPQDSLFYMHSVRYWASYSTGQEFPAVAKNASLKVLSSGYDKWRNYLTLTSPLLANIQAQGSVATPSSELIHRYTGQPFGNAVYNGLTFILPLYADDETNPPTADPIGYIQLQVADLAGDQKSFTMRKMDGTEYFVKFSGLLPVFWHYDLNGTQIQLPMYHRLKVALIANSPKRINIYGGMANVPRVSRQIGAASFIDTKENSPHIERLYASTLQGFNDGYNQVERKHLFGMDSTINVEVENTFTETLLVNGYIFGYQIYSRGMSI